MEALISEKSMGTFGKPKTFIKPFYTTNRLVEITMAWLVTVSTEPQTTDDYFIFRFETMIL